MRARPWAWVVLLVGWCAVAQGQDNTSARAALEGSGASAVVLDVRSGRVLLNVGNTDGEDAPGSTVKPFVLRAALEGGVITEHTTVHCAGTLRVGGHNLACVHPRDVTVLDARQALAESCNTYFATVARRMTNEQMVTALRAAGLRVGSVPVDVDARELMGLGLEGVHTSVRGMAEAYRTLALWMAGGSAAARAVRVGMVASVETGVAHAAFAPGMSGTVEVAVSGRSEGGLAGVGYGPGGQPVRVIAVLVTNGNGRDAAAWARQVLVGRRR